MIRRIHILGASGSGTTALGQALAEHLRCPHFDTDDYFWLPTDPPYIPSNSSGEGVQACPDSPPKSGFVG